MSDLGLSSKSSNLDLAQLSNLLNTELVENEDIRKIVMNTFSKNMSDNIARIPSASAAITTLQHDIMFMRKDLDNIASERIKLRSDLQVLIIIISNVLTTYLRRQMSGRASLQLSLMNNKLTMIIL